jgi:hypothetical protein
MQTPISNESPASQLSSCLAYYGYITYYLRQKCTSIRRGQKNSDRLSFFLERDRHYLLIVGQWGPPFFLILDLELGWWRVGM